MVFSATDGSVSAASCTNPQSANNGSGVVVTNTVDSPVPPGFDTAAASSVSSQSDLMPTNLSNGIAAINAIATDNNEAPYGGDNAATKVGGGVGTSWDWWLPNIGSFTPCLSVLQDVTMHGHPIPISNFVCGYVDNLRAGLDWFLSITTGFYVFNLMFFKED